MFIAGEYEDNLAGNSTWAEGDWNCDGEFDTQDLVAAMVDGVMRPKPAHEKHGPRPPPVNSIDAAEREHSTLTFAKHPVVVAETLARQGIRLNPLAAAARWGDPDWQPSRAHERRWDDLTL